MVSFCCGSFDEDANDWCFWMGFGLGCLGLRLRVAGVRVTRLM